jgi:P-type E1-E2 ATPase
MVELRSSLKPRYRTFNVYDVDEQQAAALKEYLESRPEVYMATVDVPRQLMIVKLAPRTYSWEVEDAAAAAGFAVKRLRSPFDETEGRLEIVLLGVTALATIASFLGNYYGLITGPSAELLGLFIALICGYPILKKAFTKVFDRKFDMDLLIALSIISPLYYTYMTGTPIFYASGIIVFIVLASYVFNRYIEPRFEALYFLLPSVGMKEGEAEPWVELKDVKAGTVLTVQPGFRVPADGTVVNGTATVTPADTCASYAIKEGMQVEGGARVEGGALQVKVAKDGGVSRLNNAADALRNARKPMDIQLSYPRSIEKILLLVSLLGTAFAILFMNSMEAAAGILLVAAPCAMLSARPLSLILSGLAASRSGAVFESHGSIERMSMADTVVFDGLDSVTEGSKLVDSAAAAGHSNDEVKAIVSSYEADDPTFKDAKGFGDGYSILSLADASRAMTVPEDLLRRARAMESKGLLTRFTFKGQDLAGVAAFELTVPDRLKESVERLGKIKGMSATLLSAEPPGAPEAVAKRLGISAKSRMRNSERIDYMEKLGKEGKNVLAAGKGCDLSRFAANAGAVTIQKPMSGLEGLEDAICGSAADVYGLLMLSRKTVKRTNEGMSFGLYFNTFAIVAASSGLIDVQLALLMVVASVVAVATNSARLYLSGLR